MSCLKILKYEHFHIFIRTHTVSKNLDVQIRIARIHRIFLVRIFDEIFKHSDLGNSTLRMTQLKLT